MILTEKDARTLQSTNRFKSVELNEKLLNISFKDMNEARAMDREIANFERTAEEKELEKTTSNKNPFI